MASCCCCLEQVGDFSHFISMVLSCLKNNEGLKAIISGYEEPLTTLKSNIEMIEAGIIKGHDFIEGLKDDDPTKVWSVKATIAIHSYKNLKNVLEYKKTQKQIWKESSLGMGLIRVFFSYSNPVIHRYSFGSWISNVNAQTIHVNKLAKGSGIKTGRLATLGDPAQVEEAELQQSRREIDRSVFVGRDSDLQVLEEALTPHQPVTDPVSVVVIVGIGGMGKSTLAKKVFENMKDLTLRKMWVGVSKDFQILRILNQMLALVGKSSSADSSEIAIQELKGAIVTPYLLVLDDVWEVNRDIWAAMKQSLVEIAGLRGCNVLVTTRNEKVVNSINASVVHRIRELSDSESKSLFEITAFGNVTVDSEIGRKKSIGTKIVQQCKGVPLAIKTIGGLLKSKQKAHHWEAIQRSPLWDLPPGSYDGTGILPSLRLSYYFLPSSYIKNCFSMFSLWPKGSSFSKEEVIGRWMALGLIEKSNSQIWEMEDMGDDYFNVLTSNFFLHEKEKDELGYIKYWTMHDLVHDLALKVAKPEILLLRGDDDGEASYASIEEEQLVRVKHLVIHVNQKSKKQKPKKVRMSKSVLSNLHTVEMVDILSKKILCHLKFLQVLCLKGLDLEKVPCSIAKLKCLGYLDLSSNPIKKLPTFVTKLYNLICLVLTDCNDLKELPRGLRNLVKMRHLHVTDYIQIPVGMIGNLISLQTLPPLLVKEKGFQIMELESLRDISGKLKIKGLEQIVSKEDAEKVNLSEKNRVEELELTWVESNNQTDQEAVLGSLCPNPNLKILSIVGYDGQEFPDWLLKMNASPQSNINRALCNIQKIQLIDCKRCKQLPTMGELPSLKILYIKGMVCLEEIAEEFYYHNGHVSNLESFPKLMELRLEGLDELKIWSGVEDSFPVLEKLIIQGCPKLETTPKFPLLQKLPTIDDVIAQKITTQNPPIEVLTIDNQIVNYSEWRS